MNPEQLADKAAASAKNNIDAALRRAKAGDFDHLKERLDQAVSDISALRQNLRAMQTRTKKETK